MGPARSRRARLASFIQRLSRRDKPSLPLPPYYAPEVRPPPPPPKDEEYLRLRRSQEARLSRETWESERLEYWEQEASRRLEGMEQGMSFTDTDEDDVEDFDPMSSNKSRDVVENTTRRCTASHVP